MNFLNFIDFFDRNVQNTILNIVKHFFGAGIWNKNVKNYAVVVVNKSVSYHHPTSHHI